MTCDRCPLSLMCLAGTVDVDVHYCSNCKLASTNYDQVAFRCANPLQLRAAIHHPSTRRTCVFCGPQSQHYDHNGRPVIQHVWYDLDSAR